ncbi:sugar phosphate isomerase/epimerase [soil metagenome]
MHDRRSFLKLATAGLATAVLPRVAVATQKPAFSISLAQWSFHKAYQSKGADKKDPLKFAELARKDFDGMIQGVEYVNQFYKVQKNDDAYLKDLKKVADDNSIKSVLIMCDGEGNLGDPDAAKRTKAVDNHNRWVEWAKYLGCHSIRVNAHSSGTPEEQMKLAADGLRKLCEFSDTHAINTIVENHGGNSSNGVWLSGVLKLVDHKRIGSLPDFGNTWIRRPDPKKSGDKGEEYDRYKMVDEIMPFAKGVSAKTHDFDTKGQCVETDYKKMMDIVCGKYKYNGFVGIEYEGSKLSEPEGVKATLKLLQSLIFSY